MNEIVNRKNEVRKQLKEITVGLSEEYMRSASSIIADKCLKSSEFENAGSIFIFVSMKGEPDTTEIIRKALEENKEVYVPRCLGGGVMEAIRLRSFDDLVPGRYGIPEPKAELEPVDPSVFDRETAVAFVPCVGATADGKRLGHGAGYYDRFLEGRKMKRLMLVYGRQLLEDIPCDSHDLLMDRVISELEGPSVVTGPAAKLAEMTDPMYIEGGVYKLPLTVTEKQLNFHGTFHGGMQYFYALEALSQYMTARGIEGVGMEGSIHYYHAVRPGDRLTASVYERKAGRTVGTYAVEITRDGVLIADTLFTIMFDRR